MRNNVKKAVKKRKRHPTSKTAKKMQTLFVLTAVSEEILSSSCQNLKKLLENCQKTQNNIKEVSTILGIIDVYTYKK